MSNEEKSIQDMTDEEFDKFMKEQEKTNPFINGIIERTEITSKIKVLNNPSNDYERDEHIYYKIDESAEFLLDETTDDQKIVLILELLSRITNINSVDYKAIEKKNEDIYWSWNNTECTDNYYYDYTEGRRRSLHDQKTDDKGYIAKSSYKATTKVIDSFVELSTKDYNADIKVVFSPIATAKIFIMKLLNPYAEFGGYLSYQTDLPNIEDIYEEGKIEIIVDDLLLIPQKRSNSAIEYFEFEIPEFMEDWRKAKEEKKYTSARYHSHHTLSAFHSETDKGEIEEMSKQKSKFFSVVSAFKSKSFDKDTDWENFDYFFNNTEIDSVLFIPFTDEAEAKANSAECGYYIETGVVFSDYTQDDLIKVKEYITRFIEMEGFVKNKYPTIKKLNQLVKKKILDENDVYHIREQLNESEHLYNVFNSLFDTLNNVVSKDKLEKQTKIIDEIKKLVK